LPFAANYITGLLKRMGYVKCYDYIFAAGSMGGTTIGVGWQYDMQRARVVQINSFDLERTLFRRRPTNLPQGGRFCVFLDIYYPYHPDAVVMGLRLPPAEWYFCMINRYFEEIERSLGVVVVIAAHPKAMKYRSQNPFGKRKIVFDCTPEAVRGADFVLTHFSNSKNCAVVANKPIIFLTSHYEQQFLPLFHALAKLQACELGAQWYYFDGDMPSVPRIFQVDVTKYSEFRYKYLTSPESESRLSANIVVSAVTGAGDSSSTEHVTRGGVCSSSDWRE